MKKVRTFVVIPSLPEPLEPLRQLAYNLWWTWTPGAIELFRRLDSDLWEEVRHNPVGLLWRVSQERLEAAANDKAYIAQLCRLADQFYIYRHGRTWFDENHADKKQELVAYFSAEFGLHECLPVYSGGLGVLAGDHLKSASDLGIPLVAVGLMYRSGYFDQQLTEDGWQLEIYPVHDFHQWPATLLRDDAGQPRQISVPIDHQTLKAQIWRVDVGRVGLYLLDADVPENPPELRSITSRLYGGDAELRMRQEILLGIGGLRALRELGLTPSVCHMNEGHAAFLALERIRQVMEEHNLSYTEAFEAVSGGNIFTTHTPVSAGIDRFDQALVQRNLGWMAEALGIQIGDLLKLGRENGQSDHGSFCMPLLALRTSLRSNAVSELHGSVARNMWQSCWPDVPAEEVPIGHVTNGVHTQFWISPQMAELFDQ
ncbi:MAG: alpha-glucan family phosphorylase, partial [Phycisphaerae bacterium]|nr:alpha-glucan family phosphorylase [Phycisphaerae bacterium]